MLIGHTENPNLLTIGSNSLVINKDTTIDGKLSIESLNINSTDINAT